MTPTPSFSWRMPRQALLDTIKRLGPLPPTTPVTVHWDGRRWMTWRATTATGDRAVRWQCSSGPPHAIAGKTIIAPLVAVEGPWPSSVVELCLDGARLRLRAATPPGRAALAFEWHADAEWTPLADTAALRPPAGPKAVDRRLGPWQRALWPLLEMTQHTPISVRLSRDGGWTAHASDDGVCCLVEGPAGATVAWEGTLPRTAWKRWALWQERERGSWRVSAGEAIAITSLGWQAVPSAPFDGGVADYLQGLRASGAASRGAVAGQWTGSLTALRQSLALLRAHVGRHVEHPAVTVAVATNGSLTLTLMTGGAPAAVTLPGSLTGNPSSVVVPLHRLATAIPRDATHDFQLSWMPSGTGLWWRITSTTPDASWTATCLIAADYTTGTARCPDDPTPTATPRWLPPVAPPPTRRRRPAMPTSQLLLV